MNRAFLTANIMDARDGPRSPKPRDSSSWELWLLALWVAFLLLVVIPWMIRHAP
jgi:hypothetical protein